MIGRAARVAMLLAVALAGAGKILAAQAPAAPAVPPDGARWLPPAGVAVLQTLDKITGRVRTAEAVLDTPLRFGTLDITVRACRKRPPEEPPESAAFLQIREVKPGEAARELFEGWMYASSPAVSALEHPVYDVWVIDCKIASPSGSRSP